MIKQKKVVSALLALLLMLSLFFSVFFIAVEADHDCTGEDCPICCQIQNCENLLKNMATVPAAVYLATGILFALYLCASYVNAPIYHITLVSLKVKLSN